MASRKVLKAAQQAEKRLDETLQVLDEMTGDDLEAIRRRRLKELKARSGKEEEWRRNGHGTYQEVQNEKDWFEEVKKSQDVVTHFYRGSTKLCEVMDKHLMALATKHLETRFIKIDAEKSPYLAQRLNIEVLPTLIFTKDNFTSGRLVGFEGLPDLDRCSTADMEKMLAMNQAIQYEGDLRFKKKGNEPGNSQFTLRTNTAPVRSSLLNSHLAMEADSDEEDW